MREIAFWCDLCRWPSRRKWILVTRPYSRRGHKSCMEVAALLLESKEQAMVTKTDRRLSA